MKWIKHIFVRFFTLGLVFTLLAADLGAYYSPKKRRRKAQLNEAPADAATPAEAPSCPRSDESAQESKLQPSASNYMAPLFKPEKAAKEPQNLPHQSDSIDALPKELQPSAQTYAPMPQPLQETEEEAGIEFQFQDANLQTLISQMEGLYDVTFLTDDMIKSQNPRAGARSIAGNTISFKTNRPLNKKEAWNLFLTFLDVAGFSVVPQPEPRLYRIVTIEASRRMPLPAFIDVEFEKLPNSDEMIRYMYFLKNASVESIKAIMDSLKSPTASVAYLNDNKAFVITDRSYNIKMLMKIVAELDRVCMPQAMAVIKLRNVDAADVKKLYETITQTDANRPMQLFGARKQPTSLYFPENTRLIDEPRTNSLILLGSQDAIKKIEDFITKYIDVELDQSYSPLYVYQLKYADAVTIADVMNEVTDYGKKVPGSPLAQGGVRGKDKFMKPIEFIPDKETNRIIIKGDYESYQMAKEIIDTLDEAQPQIALEVLIVSLDVDEAKELGTQLRSKVDGTDGFLGKNVKFQTSGLNRGLTPCGIQENMQGPGVERLLGNILNCVIGAPAGNTIVTLGQDLFGVWGVFQALQTITNLQIVANPFLLATNGTKASVSVGETRRILAAQVVANNGTTTDTREDSNANLSVDITPRINSDGLVILDIGVQFNQFSSADPTNGNQTTRNLRTIATVADQEVLAIGGLIRNRVIDTVSKTPLLGDIPVLGWLFKNKRKEDRKENLLILISTRIIEPELKLEVDKFTDDHIQSYRDGIQFFRDQMVQQDPINRTFFADQTRIDRVANEFLIERHRKREVLENGVSKKAINQKNEIKQKGNRSGPSIPSAPSSRVLEEFDPESIPVACAESAHNKLKNKKRSKLSLTQLVQSGTDS